MINLITGTPGSGKTSYALQFLLDQLHGSKRKIYVHGIDDLKIPHEKVYCRSPSCDSCNSLDYDLIDNSLFADQWHDHAPDGAVYFFDEVQNIYRPRSSSSKVPPSVAAFEVHRHKGLDFFLITQNPKLIDVNIRSLVSRHIHLKPTWAGRYQYEWSECKDSVQSTTDAIKSTYKLDKKTFALYKSASIHTKQKRKIPFVFFILIFSFFVVGFLSYQTYLRVSAKTVKKTYINKPSDLVAAPASAGDSAKSSGLLDNNSDEFLDYDQLSLKSYSIVEPSKLSPTLCFIVSSQFYRCFIPPSYVSRFKSSYCINNTCYALLRYSQLPNSSESYINSNDSHVF